MRGGAAAQQLARLGPLQRELKVVLPREAHCAEQLQAVPEHHRLRLSRGRLGHRGRESPARIVGRDRQRREVRQGPGTFGRDVHVDGLVLHRLKRTDRDAELLTLLGVFEDQIEDALAGADRGDGHTGQRDVVGAFGVHADPHRVGHPHVDERHLGDVQHRIEDRAAPRGDLVGVDDENTGLCNDREPLGSVTVEDVPGGAVEHPAVVDPVRSHAVVNRRARLSGIEPVTGQRGELRQRRQKGCRVGGPPQFLQHDRQFHRVFRVGQLGPTGVDVGRPQRRRVDPVLGDAANQRRRALLGHRVAHGLLPESLIGVELQ